MKTIRSVFDTVRIALGSQKYKNGKKYRKSLFCIEVNCPEGLLLYNTLTGELLLLDQNETDTWSRECGLMETLVAHWFLVPSDTDEIKLCNQMRRIVKLLHHADKYINNFTVFTTTDCNARCFYCFEHGQKRFHMTEKTAYDVACYMLSQANGKKVKIRWFGGEPLYNMKVIDIISEELQKQGAEYESTMVSNAYLFDEIIAKKAKQLWHLKHVLVTIDGTEEVYNQIKAFIYDEGSAYKRVISGIRQVLLEGIAVTVNLSLDTKNTQVQFDLADELGRLFGSFPNFNARAGLLIEYVAKIHAFETAKQALNALQSLNDRLESCGIREHRLLRSSIMLNSCMADDAHTVTILPDGRLGRCEHFGDSEEIGNIYGAWDEKKVAEWCALRSIEETCTNCAFYPQCFRLIKCNACPNPCNELYRGQHKKLTIDMVHNTYMRYLKNNGGQNEILN